MHDRLSEPTKNELEKLEKRVVIFHSQLRWQALQVVFRTFAIALAFSTHAVTERIAGVSWQTGANGTFFAGIIVTGNALSIGSTRVWTAQIFFCEGTATDEGITGHVTRATTDGS